MAEITKQFYIAGWNNPNVTNLWIHNCMSTTVPSSICQRWNQWKPNSQCWRSHQVGQMPPHTCPFVQHPLQWAQGSLQTASHPPTANEEIPWIASTVQRTERMPSIHFTACLPVYTGAWNIMRQWPHWPGKMTGAYWWRGHWPLHPVSLHLLLGHW